MVTFTAKDEAGQTLDSVVRTLSPGGHEAQNMVSLFGLSSFSGSLEVASTEPIVSLSLNFEAAPVFSSLPPGELDAGSGGTAITRTSFESSTPEGYTAVTLATGGVVWGVPARYTSDSAPGTVAYMLLGELKGCDFANAEADRRSKVYIKTQSLGTLNDYESKTVCRKTSSRWLTSWPGVRITLLLFFDESSPSNTREAAYNETTEEYSIDTSTHSGEPDAADIPGEMFAPADEAAFNTLFVGKRAATNFPTAYADFVSPGRFRETAGADTYTGSYTYQNTGSNTGTVTFNYDDGDRCTTHLTFDSTTSGTATFTCNDGSSGAYNWHLVEIPGSGAPDLVIQTPSVSDSSPNAGGSFTLSATVRNQGNGLSASTTLRYYRSTDATISTGDTQVGTDAVSGLSASGASDESLSLTAPSTAGTYYYGACVDAVSGESDTRNNCSRAVTVTVASSTGKPFNQQQTERLIGTWVFTYRIVSEWTDTYRLNDVRESPITPGEWNIFGTDQYDNLVIAGYSPSLGMFSLFDQGITIDQFFTFDFVGSNTVSGCYYQVDKDDNSLSRCFDMTGVRTSSSTLSSLKRALPNTTATQAELGEIEEAKKLGIEMQIEVDPKIIRALEDFREVLRQ